MSLDQELKWKKEYEEFRNTLPGYTRSGFSRFQGELVYLSARRVAQDEIESLKKENEIMRSALESCCLTALSTKEDVESLSMDTIPEICGRMGSIVKRAREALSKSEAT